MIRHGQTDYNAQGIVQGKGVDLSLNETGRKQAQAFFDAYKDIPFDILYTSSLKRAQETVESFIELGITHEADSDLDEISWGDLEGAVATRESDKSFQELLQRWRAGDIHAKASPSGESPHDLQIRQNRFLKKMLATPHEKILISSHGRFIRAFMCTLTGQPLSNMENFMHVNLCLYKVNMTPYGKFEIELHCDKSHLKDV